MGVKTKVSVVVPTYNRAALLFETLSSILSQTYDDIEIIVVDNFSDDETISVVGELNDSRIKFYQNRNYGVISTNRNYGINIARGEYICFCDSDDLWETEKVATQVEFMQKHKDIALCFTDGRVINEENVVIKNYFRKYPPVNIGFNTLITHNYISTLSVMIRKEVLSDIGGFNESKLLVGIEDFHLWLRVAKKYSVNFLSEYLFRYRIHCMNEMGDDSYRWARKCMILSKFMYSEGTLSIKEFIIMYGYNLVKLLRYSLSRL